MGGGGGCGEAVVGLPGPPDQQHPRNLPQPDHQVLCTYILQGNSRKGFRRYRLSCLFTIYTIYLILCKQTVETISPEPSDNRNCTSLSCQMDYQAIKANQII